MPARKIPADALAYYVSLGAERSYQKVAAHYGVTKRAVVNVARRDGWQRQVGELERTAHEQARETMRSTIEATYEQHMKALRMVFAKGVQALNRMVLETPAEALKAIQLAIREMRVALGEPTDRTAVSVEETIRREYERWMVATGGDELEHHPEPGLAEERSAAGCLAPGTAGRGNASGNLRVPGIARDGPCRSVAVE